MSTPVQLLALTIREAAQTLGVSERTIRRAIAARKLRVVRIGRCVRVPQDSISALLSGPDEWVSVFLTPSAAPVPHGGGRVRRTDGKTS